MKEHHNFTWQDGFTQGYKDFGLCLSPKYRYRFNSRFNYPPATPEVLEANIVLSDGSVKDFAVGYIDGFNQASDDREEFMVHAEFLIPSSRL